MDDIIRKPSLDSTNAYAQSLSIDDDLACGTVVLTYNQTNGRGQLTNHWESEIGKNLTISVILKPKFIFAGDQFNISRIISLAIYDVLNSYMENVSIKWPNDIYVGNKKIAGVLIENTIMGSSIEYSICGIGLNVNQSLFLSNAPNPTSMFLESGRVFDTEKILVQLRTKINDRMNFIRDNGANSLNSDYQKNMYRNNGEYKFKDVDSSFMASVEGVNEYGQLLLKRTNGLVSTYSFKEVSFVF